MGSNTTTTGGTTAAAQTSSSQTTKDPYAGVLPWTQDLAVEARKIYDAQPMQSALAEQSGFDTPYRLGNQFLDNSKNGITAQMQDPLDQLAQISRGGNVIDTGDLYRQIFNQAQPLAGNTSGALTETQQAILDQNSERLGNRLASQYSGSGRYGSFGAGIGLARGIAETNNPLMAQYNQANIGNSLAAMGIQQGAAGGLSNVQQQNIGNQMNAANSQLSTYNQGIGNMQRQMALQPGNLDLALAPQKAFMGNLQTLGATLAPMYPLFANDGTVTTNANTTSTGQTTGQTETPTPWTTYAGLGIAGIGAGGRLLSDRRLKTDIKKVGKDPWTDLNMYQWRYKGQPKSTPKFVGPMAQEVQKKYPEAVGELPGGILYIKKAA